MDDATAWNTARFDKFRRWRHLLVDGPARHSDALLSREPYRAPARVLDVGCGFGDTTLRIARELGPQGTAVGVDRADNFVRAACLDAEAAGIGNASFFCADVQQDELRGPYDHLFARFGTMFFEQPEAAMRRLRGALKPGGSFRQIVWRRREDNPWVHEAERIVRAILPPAAQREPTRTGPGPFSMAEPELVRALLQSAGFEGIAIERFDVEVGLGRDLDEAVEFAMALGPAGELLRLAGDAAEPLRPRIADALREAFARRLRPDGVRAPSGSWFVSARAP